MLFQRKWLKNNIILVPSEARKTALVNASNTILVDDNTCNLDDWYLCNGYPIFFNSNGDNFSCYNDIRYENSYHAISNLEDIYSKEFERKYCLKIKKL